jgi:stage V sporulation protein R
VTGVDLKGNRRLILTHSLNNGVPLTEQDAQAVLAYVADLWGYEVHLLGVDGDGTERYRYEAAPPA